MFEMPRAKAKFSDSVATSGVDPHLHALFKAIEIELQSSDDGQSATVGAKNRPQF